MIAIIDYGMGNLRSVQKALETTGAFTIITQDADDLKKAERIVLPGVGAMAPAMARLKDLGLIKSIHEAIADKKPFLGICLGFQLLFDSSDEGGHVQGLGLIPGSVRRFQQGKIPHMGWNQLNQKNASSRLFSGIENHTHVYFCHSYYAAPKEVRISTTTTDYGIEFTSSIEQDPIYGVQFHPEKSQAVGLKILKNFVEK